MKSFGANFVNVQMKEADYLGLDDLPQEIPEIDPLEGVAVESAEPKYSKLTSVVFAEPLVTTPPALNFSLSSNRSEDFKKKADEEVTFIENVTIVNSGGKYKKYLFDVDPNKPKCPQANCGKEFSNASLLKAHVRKIHCSDRNRFQCDVCQNGFTAKYLLQRHMAVHNGKTKTCPICYKTFSERTNMTSHIRAHEFARAFACVACDRRFARRSALSRHFRFVHEASALVCDVCHERFKRRLDYERHRKLHSLPKMER